MRFIRTAGLCAVLLAVSLLVMRSPSAFSADLPPDVPITVQDLPPGFTAVPAELSADFFGPWDDQLDYAPKGEFLFFDLQKGYLLAGATAHLASDEDILLFDLLLDNPQTLLDVLQVQDDIPFQLMNPTVLETVPVGDLSVAISFQIPTEELDMSELAPQAYEGPAQVDIHLFRRGPLIAMTFLIYPPSDQLGFDLGELAVIWYERLDASEESSPAPTFAPSPTLRPTDTPTPSPTPSPTAAPAAQAVVAVNALNLREGPSFNFAKLGVVALHDALEVIGQHDNCAWLQVLTPNGDEGWVSGAAQYVTFQGDCSQIQQGSFRPATGQRKRFIGSDGLGELLIDNGGKRDGVAVLTTMADASVLSAYIRAGEEYRMTGIPDGIYRLYYAQGEDWDDEAKTFTKNVALGRFDDSFPFTTTDTQYRIWEVTLHGVLGGTATTSAVPEDEFPAIE